MDIIVVGGGVGGLAVAVGLVGAGHEVRVFERQRGDGAAGSGLVLAPNGLRAVDHLSPELGERVRSLRVPQEVEAPYTTLTSTGALLGVDRTSELFEQRWGDRLLPVHRRELLACLRAALPAGVIVDGQTVESVNGDSDRATVTTADGAARHADLVIGADGVWSKVRRHVAPEVSPRFIGVTSLRGVSKGDTDPYPNGFMTHGLGRTMFTAPVSGGMYWAVTLNAAERAWPSLDPDEARRRLVAILDGWHEPVRSLVENTVTEELVVTDLHETPALDRWSSGCVTLLGDAAHTMPPFMGMGANVALEDAAVLVTQLAGHGTDLSQALRSYEHARRDRVARIMKLTRQIGRFTRWHNPIAVAVRNRMMKAMLRSDDLDGQAWMYDWRP